MNRGENRATPHGVYDELVAWATSEERKGDVVDAKAEYFERVGPVYEEDRQLELRMAAFLEFYLCDRVAPHFGCTPARARYEASLRDESPDRALAFRAWTETQHGLFEVQKIRKGQIRLCSLYGDLKSTVTERRQLVGLSVGDVLECRLVPFQGGLYFSQAYCFHPTDAAPLIRKEAARRQKLAVPPLETELIFDCATRALKIERYRQISVANIYSFDASAI